MLLAYSQKGRPVHFRTSNGTIDKLVGFVTEASVGMCVCVRADGRLASISTECAIFWCARACVCVCVNVSDALLRVLFKALSAASQDPSSKLLPNEAPQDHPLLVTLPSGAGD